jgi:PAS domain-containing protein
MTETTQQNCSMAAHEIEIILNRQLADCLSMPVFITDTAGNLIYYNEPAELILGKRFEETGEMPVAVWGTIFKPVDENRNPLSPEDLPLVKTIMHQKPYHKTFYIESLSGKIEKISVTSYPIMGRPSRFIGAVALFWDTNKE